MDDRVRRELGQKKRAAALEKELLANLPPDHPMRRAAEEKERDQQARREAEARGNPRGI